MIIVHVQCGWNRIPVIFQIISNKSELLLIIFSLQNQP